MAKEEEESAGFSVGLNYPARDTTMCSENPEPHQPDPIELPIDGALDLHTFRPQEIKALVPDYLRACQAKGILRVRIIHGKGIGNLRRTVHSILSKHPDVISFSLASEHFGGWGATNVHLRPLERTSH